MENLVLSSKGEEMLKQCSKCKKIKHKREFNRDRTRADKLSYWCKECCLKYYKIYTKENKEKESKRSKKYRELHKKEIKIKHHKYYELNKDACYKRNKAWIKENKDKHKNNNRKYKNNRYKNNIRFKIRNILATRINHALKGKDKSLSTMMLIGCEIDYLLYYIQSKFKPGMGWSNYGRGDNSKGMSEWNIDHIKPCVKFDLSKPEEQRKCFNFKNLQPLWAEENKRKNKHEKYKYV